MNRTHTIHDILDKVSDDEWLVIQARCKDRMAKRLKHHKFGAHSPQRLGCDDPFDHYFLGAYTKLVNGEWELKHELTEQLCRIMGSMISESVRKFKKEKEDIASKNKISIESLDKLLDMPHSGIYKRSIEEDYSFEKDPQEEYDRKVSQIKKAIQGDLELEKLFQLLANKAMSYDEICQHNGWPKSKLYRLSKKLKRKIENNRL